MLRMSRVSNIVCRSHNYNHLHVASFSTTPSQKRRGTTESEEEQSSSIKVLYEETSSRNIRAMMFATGINLTYWGFNSSLTIFENFQASVPLGMGTIGGAELDTFLFFASSALVGATKLYADHSVMKVYENVEANRIGFQVHTLLGFPGKYLEVPVGNTTIEDGGKSGMVGVRVVGMHRPLILPNSDKFRDCAELHELLLRKQAASSSSSSGVGKKERIGWRSKSPRGLKQIKL